MAIAALSEISLTPIFDNNGALVRNARLYFYRPDTLDPVTVYKDQELSVPHPQPIQTGGSGRVPPIYVGQDPYRIRIFDNANQLVEDIPWLPGATETTDPGGGGSDTAIRTGDVIWAFSNGGVREGWVRLNGGSIGNSLSGANERANDDAHDLFLHLWGQDTAGLLTVTPSRGASAESDWLANKTLTLPDGAGAILGGITTMGRPERPIPAGVNFTLGTATQVGARMGTFLHVLTVAQLAQHAHGVTDPGHTHTASQPAHSHGVSDPGHAHGITDPTHGHAVYDPGHNHGVNDPGHAHGVSDPGHTHDYRRLAPTGLSHQSGSGGITDYDYSDSANTGRGYTGISIAGSGTGIWLNAAGTGIGIYGAYTGISVNGASSNIGIQNAQPAITVAPQVTGITIGNQGNGEGHNTVQPTILGTFYMKL